MNFKERAEECIDEGYEDEIPNPDYQYLKKRMASYLQQTHDEAVMECIRKIDGLKRHLDSDEVFNYGEHEYIDTCDIYKALQSLLINKE